MDGDVVAVIIKTNEGRKLDLVLQDDDIHVDSDGDTIITLNWKKIALEHAAYLDHLREERRREREEAQATPPEYNEND